jgi:choice-of-anchor B domain-containing protein
MNYQGLTRVVAAAICAMSVASTVRGHADDPKVNDRQNPYVGPAYRAADKLALLGEQFDSNGVTLMAWLPIAEFGSHSSANDCWGYVSPSGREYAIIGLSNGTGFVDITNPASPVIVDTLSGPNSLWRDIKTYQSFAYAVSEGGGGIQIFDLSDIDNGNVASLGSMTDSFGTTSTHNVAIDDVSGWLYRVGGTNEGLRMYSLANPANPVYVASWPDRYVHDAQVVTMNTTELGVPQPRQIAFCASGFNGGFVDTGIDILDVTDKNNIELIARYQYPTSPQYSHQCWISEDRTLLYLNDELNEQNAGLSSTMHIIDISDLSNPVEVNAITNGNSAITHNLYVRDEKIYAANYRSGLRIFDAAGDPADPTEIAYFDTYPGSDSPQFNGLWSSYPFFPSGIVIGSDLERGLFVWFAGDPELAFEFPAGVPALVNPQGGSFTVRILEQGTGELAAGTATLHYDDGTGYVSLPLTLLGGDMYEATFPPLLCPGNVDFFISADSQLGLTWRGPAAGASSPFVAAVAVDVATVYENTFDVPSGWTPENLGAASGDWQRGTPVNDPSWDYDPATDSDGSGNAWLTDNGPGNTDVDDGAVELLSPGLDITGGSATITFDYYLRLTEPGTSDFLTLDINDNAGSGWVEVLAINTDTTGGWGTISLSDEDLLAFGISATTSVQLRFTANDANPQSIVEAGIDHVRIELINCDTIEPPACAADCAPNNGDGTFGNQVINIDDLLAVINDYGATDSPCDIAPDNGDGTVGNGSVNIDDVLTVINAFGPCP